MAVVQADIQMDALEIMPLRRVVHMNTLQPRGRRQKICLQA